MRGRPPSAVTPTSSPPARCGPRLGRRRQRQALQLPLRAERLCRAADAGPGAQAPGPQGRPQRLGGPAEVRRDQRQRRPSSGLNDANGGLRRDLDLRGEDIVIGVIDSGIAPGHPSLSDKEAAKRPRLCKSAWGQVVAARPLAVPALQEQARHARLQPTARLAGRSARRATASRHHLQQQADRRPLLHRRLPRGIRPGRERVHLAQGRRRARHAHRVHRGRQLRPGHAGRDPRREDQRHGAARARRRVQSLLARAGPAREYVQRGGPGRAPSRTRWPTAWTSSTTPSAATTASPTRTTSPCWPRPTRACSPSRRRATKGRLPAPWIRPPQRPGCWPSAPPAAAATASRRPSG